MLYDLMSPLNIGPDAVVYSRRAAHFRTVLVVFAIEMTYIVSGGALNSTHSLTPRVLSHPQSPTDVSPRHCDVI